MIIVDTYWFQFAGGYGHVSLFNFVVLINGVASSFFK